MADGIEAGAGLAWRLLATLEGGSLLLATSALIAYTAKARVKKHKRRRHVNSVLVTNTTNSLGKEVKQRLEACGCIVHSCSVPSDATSVSAKVDALLVIGAETRPGLEGIAELVSADVYDNLKLLETLSLLVQRGGCIAWASAGASNNAYSEATHAFDAVLRASLKYVAKKARCEAIWIDRDESVERVAESVVAALVPCDTRPLVQPYPMRNIAVQISKFFGRWLKIIT